MISLYALLIGCLPPLAYKNYAGHNFKTTRSPCVDALYVNLDASDCDDALILDLDSSDHYTIKCIDYYPGIIDDWTMHSFYITSRYNSEKIAEFENTSYKWFCSDRNMILYTKN